MIEWIVGALVLGGLLSAGSKKSKKTAPIVLRPSRTRISDAALSDDEQLRYASWKREWNSTVDRSQWIPKSKASQIIKQFPFPTDDSNTFLIPRKNERLEKALVVEFSSHNDKFLAAQKVKLAAFFSSVESNPLTAEQMNSCICMDDAVQIVAAAGSGKTSAMVARIGYMLQEGLARPEQILVLAFNRSVKEELEARIKERLAGQGDVHKVTVKTFNAFGLEVIGKSTGRKPRLADWLGTGQDIQAITEIIENLRLRDPKFALDWDMFRTVFGRDAGDWDKITQPDDDGRRTSAIRTADGKLVKSNEERMISDFLFYHGVDYQYERPYEHDTVTEDHSQYHPDFYYPRIKLYHEHFALNASGNAPAHFTGDYVAGVHWKRKLHDERQTQLFETTSNGIRNGDDLLRLKAELEARGLKMVFDGKRKATGQEPIPTKQLASTIRAFQQHAKSNGLSLNDLRKAISNAEDGHRDRLTRFVDLYARIADEWQKCLRAEESVDYDDMLLMAIEHIENGKFQTPYTMILVDEFQDTSQAKLRLLKGLKKSAGASSSLGVVGDDWQGINRFAGADISVMVNFQTTFEHSTQLVLSKTFRCPQLLCDASSEFIQKNPTQIRKKVETNNTYAKNPLHAFAADNLASALERLENDLRSLFGYARDGQLNLPDGAKARVMLLGRYHRDKPAKMNAWVRAFARHLDLSFSTAHAAKGMEADYVMILNVTEGLKGFPSQIVDDPVLQLAMPQPDTFPLAEERRLFYVAITRARRQTRIYSLAEKPSRFLVELANDGHLRIETEHSYLKLCPKCGDGTLKQIVGKFGPFEACSDYPRCDFKRNLLSSAKNRTKGASQSVRLSSPIAEGATCPTCGRGRMVMRKGKFLGCSSFPRCRTTAAIAPP